MEKKEESQSDSQYFGVWAFVLNPQIVIEAELPFELAPNCSIDNASEEQRERIRKSLSYLVSSHPMMTRPETFYESEIVYETTANSRSWHYKELPESKWHYYVVTTPDNGSINHDLHLAANISDTPFDLAGLTFNKMGMGFRQGTLQNYFDIGAEHPVIKVSRESLIDISLIYRSYLNATKGELEGATFPEIQRAMSMFDALSLLPKNSEFHVLGLFAIIEMLITHNPKLEDRGDSITHQMQSKIPLLSRRFSRPLDFSSFLSNVSEKTIWAALYKYRSTLAHGSVPNFQKDLNILKDASNAKAFLREVVKALLRHCLKEPQLYKDLRDC